MPFVSQEQLKRFTSMEAELRVFDEMRPFLHLAVELKMGIEAALDEDPELTAKEIGELAYQRVLKSGIEQARNEVASVYENEHRKEIYQEVVQEVEKTEGAKIFEEVKNRLDSDPELARELRDSVRKDIGARAMGDVRKQLSEEQEEAIEEEAKRQLKLDRLDVELAIEGKLDLFRDDINELLHTGDTLDLIYTDNTGHKKKIQLKWVKDGHDQTGWVLASDMTGIIRRDGSNFPISKDQFVEVGTLESDLKEGTKIVTPNLLTVDMPLVLTQGAKKKQPDHCVPYTGSSHPYYADERKPAVLKGIDFKTKDLEFFSQKV